MHCSLRITKLAVGGGIKIEVTDLYSDAGTFLKQSGEQKRSKLPTGEQRVADWNSILSVGAKDLKLVRNEEAFGNVQDSQQDDEDWERSEDEGESG